MRSPTPLFPPPLSAAQPLEVLNPLLQSPGLNRNLPLWVNVLSKLKPLLMSVYFGADHVVWAQQVGVWNSPAAALAGGCSRWVGCS